MQNRLASLAEYIESSSQGTTKLQSIQAGPLLLGSVVRTTYMSDDDETCFFREEKNQSSSVAHTVLISLSGYHHQSSS